MTERYCPICEQSSDAFKPAGAKKRPGEKCPTCGSKPRQREAWLALKRRTNFFDASPKRFLHIAPDKSMRTLFSQLPGIDYLSADLKDPRAMVHMDLTCIPFKNSHFDAIYCCHVLEHIRDDGKAITELQRILQPGGWALIQVPVSTEETTREFSTPTFKGHVRKYGLDFEKKLRAGGFTVEVIHNEKEFTPEEFAWNALSTIPLYYCTKS